jgi:hypothetical protein
LCERYEHFLSEAEAILSESRARGDSRLSLEAMKQGCMSIEKIGRTLGLVQGDGGTVVDARSLTVYVSREQGGKLSVSRIDDLTPAETREVLEALPAAIPA